MAAFFNVRTGTTLVPAADAPGLGWYSWYDQTKYRQALHAWLDGNLSPSEHWYPPAYPLMGALFHAVTPADPFVIPNLICLLGSGWIFSLLGARLMGGAPGARALSAALFALATAGPELAMAIWAVPWTSTPAAPLILLCLWASIQFADRPGARPCFVAAFAAACLVGIRPADALVAGLPAGLLIAWTLVRRRPGWRPAAAITSAAALGAAAPLLVWAMAHVAVWGWSVGGYYALSGRFGFEWRLLPLRWVTIMVGAVPLNPEGRGLAEAFPWIAPGLAGMAACLLAPGRAGRAAHAAVIGAASLHVLLLLSYRDLHPDTLWRNNNYHYFKWLLPIFALYGALFLDAARRARWAAVSGAGAALCLMMWRADLEVLSPGESPPAAVEGKHDLVLPHGFPSVRDAVLVPADGSATDILASEDVALMHDRRFAGPYDLRSFPRPGGLMLTPLRPFPPGAARVTFGSAVTLDPASPPLIARQHVVFGVPCWAPASWRAECRLQRRLPGRPLGVGQPIKLDRSASGYEGVGWANPDEDGTWTDGPTATLQFRLVPPAAGQDLELVGVGGGYVPSRGGKQVDAAILVNGAQVGDWHPESGMVRTMRTRIPSGLIGPTGDVILRFVLENSRRPADYGDGSDRRSLGLKLLTLTLTPAS